ncbi:sensor histidine kinase [Nocardioides marmorisolisilvae]|uniref:histidine kinase n=1 Tax=Nocardioides marmorisolisilvae TaxID=1542737 RepID=A0A3N0DZR4_9ACTN|nr:sensor histidine kinase [Nocardioides marmorisolisilvae]
MQEEYFRRTVHFGRRSSARGLGGAEYQPAGDGRVGATKNRTRTRLGRLAAPGMALFIGGLSIAFAFIAADVNKTQEQQLLTERAGELSSLLSVSTSETRSVLLVAGSSGSTPDAAKSFAAVTAAMTSTGTSTISLARRQGSGYAVVRSAGRTAPAPGTAVSPEVTQMLARATKAKDMVSGVVDLGGSKHIVLALAVATDPGNVAFLDSALGPARPTPSAAGSPFRELDVAVYAGATVDPRQLLLVSGDLPHGTVVTKQFQVGTSTWSIAASAREPLIGTVASAFPWLLVGGGLLTAAVLGLLIETLVRRREYALRLVDERTRLLVDAQAEAERANVAREEFFASVSHDIRAPLTAIMGFTEMMSIAEPDEQDVFVQRVRSNVATLGVMVDNMLDHARLQAGALEVQLEPLCLKELVEDCLRDLEPVLTSHKIAVTGAPVMVMADRSRSGGCWRTSWSTRSATRRRARRSTSSSARTTGWAASPSPTGAGASRRRTSRRSSTSSPAAPA